MVQRNKNIARLKAGYLFPEITRRKNALLAKEPGARIISLGVGNTTEPITPHITEGLVAAARGLGTKEGYSGYGEEQGLTALRERIAERYYNGRVGPEEIFISDGAKCDIGRLQILFGPGARIAVQDPSYPVYVDGAVITGMTGGYSEERGGFEGITYLACTPENGFFPDLEPARDADLLYFCSPNNPTGAVSTFAELKRLIDFAKAHRAVILFDAAYAMYIQEAGLPRTIYEIEGARDVVIEMNSFSKPAGFTGVRLGWTAVPKNLLFEDGTPMIRDWHRLSTTLFNGASNIVQQGGLAAFDDEGLQEMERTVAFYMENAAIIKAGLDDLGFETFGGTNAPYIWTRTKGKSSWDAFEEVLYKARVVTTPGLGFGPSGEGFIRFGAFGHRGDIEEAVARLRKVFG